MAYTEFYHVEMHVFTKAHITNSKAPNAGLVRPMVKNDIPENHCVLCSVDIDPKVGKSHLQSPEHNRKKMILNNYLEYCLERNQHPLTNVQVVPDFQAQEKHSFADLQKALKIWNLEKNLSSPTVTPVLSPALVKEESKKLEFETYGLSKDEADLVTRCPKCYQKFHHATYLLYHLLHMHKEKPSKFIGEVMKNHNKLLTCSRCMKKCKSPIIMAIHHDRHQVI